MNATTMSMSEPQVDLGLDRVAHWLLLLFVAALQLSIAAANILLAATVVTWVAVLARDRRLPSAPFFFVPLLVYAGLTVASSFASLDPRESFIDDKQLLLFAIVPMVFDLARGRRATTVVDVLLAVGAASAAFGIIQYGLLHYDNLGRRPEGALTHYMTYSGILMLVICVAAARLIFGSGDRRWPALVMPALVVALSLTLTRNAWIGAAAAVGVLLLLRDRRLTAVLPVVIALFFVLAPGQITQRMESTFNAQDPANQDRLAMLEIGALIARDHPLTGVGPNMVPRVYEQYRPEYAVNQTNPHLHNVPMQIVAERGIPALIAWVVFIAAIAVGLLRQFRQGRERLLDATAIAAVVAMLAAGLFEYNFGDSEFLMTFLVLITLPFAAARDGIAASAAAPRRA